MINTVDSSAWVEYFIDGPNATFFAAAIEDTANLLVPSIALHEVFRITLQHQNEGQALKAIAQMKQGSVCDLTDDLALSAAKISFEMSLPLVESIVLATARARKARLWTQDDHFRGLDGVQFRARNKS
jgi:predicted nucleic acid-binding protein